MVIKELNFKDITEYKNTNVIPVFMRYGNECFELLNNSKDEKNDWSIFLKIFYNKLYEQNKDYFDSIVNKIMFTTKTFDGMVVIFDSSSRDYFKLSKNNNLIKFSDKYYIVVMNKMYSNIVVLKQLLKETKLNDFQLFVTMQDNKCSEELSKELNELKTQYKSATNSLYKVKKGKFVASYINGLILNKYEKLNYYLKKEFGKRNLLGDITLSNDQEELVNEIFKNELKTMVRTDLEPNNRIVFALGLVRYAMKNYNKSHSGDFWPHFKNDYGIIINTNKQQAIHNLFERIMKEYNKVYFDEVPNKIDCITMHSFVADNSASQLFDFLFDFWRIDLSRNINNLYNGEDGYIAYNDLIDAMKNAQGSIMSHTSILLNNPKITSIFKSRVKRILRLIDESFWNDTLINETGNRINHLLNEWINNPKGLFQKEKNYVAKHSSKEKGEVLFHTPIFNINYSEETLNLVLPHQRLINCDVEDKPIWIIKCSYPGFETKIIPVEEHYKNDKLGQYIEKMIVNIPFHLMLSSFEITLMNNEKELKKYKIHESNIRFFDANGKFIDHYSVIIPSGFVTAYSNNDSYPNVLGENYKPLKSNGLYMKNFELLKGQIIVLEDLSGLQVGQNLTEGLNEFYPINGAELVNDEIIYKIYPQLPKLLFKSDFDELSGVSLIINSKQNRVVDNKYDKFKISDELKAAGFLIDLNDYISEEGLYQIILSYPKMHKQIDMGNIAFIKDFNYKFVDVPYIFEDFGKIEFDKKLRIDTNTKESDGNWSSEFTKNTFFFNFGERNNKSENYCDLVKDDKLKLNCNIKNKKYPIYFEIPALYWKFKIDDEWSTKKPANISLKKIKNKKLYVKGPFIFSKSIITTTDDIDIADEESEIKIVNSIHPYFEIEKVYNWFKNNRNDVYRKLYITLNDQKIEFLNVICKSELRNIYLIGDFDNNILKGVLDINGDENYTVSIYRNGKLICEDEQVINKSFSFKNELETGIYEIYVYEMEEDEEDGFDVGITSIQLNQVPIKKKLINIKKLENQKILLNGYQDIKQKYRANYFNKQYIITDLEAYSYSKFLIEKPNSEIYGIWNESIDITDEKQTNNFIFYKGKMGFADKIGNSFNQMMKVIIIFIDKTNPESILILAKDADDIDYGSLEIDISKGWIIPGYRYKKMSIMEKMKCRCFYDDQDYYLIDIEEE